MPVCTLLALFLFTLPIVPFLKYRIIGTHQILLDRRQCEHTDHQRPACNRNVAGDMVLRVSRWKAAAESAGDDPR